MPAIAVGSCGATVTPPPVSASISLIPGIAEATTARPAARYSASFIGRPIASSVLPGERQTREAATYVATSERSSTRR